MNVDLKNIKTEFEDYKEKQQYFKIVNQKQKKGTVIWESKEKTVDGGFIGKTYKKKTGE